MSTVSHDLEESQPEVNQATPVHTKDLTARFESIDGAKLNRLLDNVNFRLGSDVYGNFKLKGSTLGKDTRHAQLQEVVELVRVLEEVKALMEGKSAPLASEGSKEAKKPGKANSNQIATIRNVVQGEIADKLRDLLISRDRLEERVKKLEGENQGLSNKVHTFESRPKAQLGRVPDARIMALEHRVDRLHTENTELKNKMQKVETEKMNLESRMQQVDSREVDFESWVHQVRQVEERVDDIVHKCRFGEQLLADRVYKIETEKRELEIAVQQVEGEKLGIDERLQSVEDEVGRVDQNCSLLRRMLCGPIPDSR